MENEKHFTPLDLEETEKAHTGGAWLFNPGQREISREESDRALEKLKEDK